MARQFMLLLYDEHADGTPPDLSPEEIQGVIQEYSAWAGKMAGEGRFVDGHKLTDGGGRVVAKSGRGDVTVTDGPYAESKEVIGGLYIIKADDYDHAVELARSCPHMRHGLRTEVREIDLLGSDE